MENEFLKNAEWFGIEWDYDYFCLLAFMSLPELKLGA